MTNDTDFGDLLRRYREAANLSQSKLADMCGVDHSYISRIEQGSRMPSVGMADSLAANLGLDGDDYDAFMGAAGYGVTNLRNAVYEPLCIDLDDLIAASPPDVAADLRASLRSLLRVRPEGSFA